MSFLTGEGDGKSTEGGGGEDFGLWGVRKSFILLGEHYYYYSMRRRTQIF